MITKVSPPEVVSNQGAEENSANGISPANLTPADPLDALAQHVDGTFVLVVKVAGGKYRRRCFLSAAAAERAARRALDAGHIAYIYLAELKPLWRLSGGAS